MLKDYLTIIVTIKDRRNTLPRIFNYYKDFPCNVIYLDSTNSEAYNGNPDPHEYRHVPGENYCKKLYECCSSIKTKYSIIVCDDDFLSPTGLDACVDFLESNQNFVGCLGQEVTLLDSFFVIESLDYFTDTFYDFESDCPKQRVKNSWYYFNGGQVGAVIRNETQINTHKFHLTHRPFNAMRIFDKTKAFLMAAEGNFARLPIFYCARSQESKAVSLLRSEKKWANNWRPNLTFNDYFIDPKVIDTSPLEEVIGVDRSFIEDIHKNLCDCEKKQARHKEILEYNILPEKCIVHVHNLVNNICFMIKEEELCSTWIIEALISTIKNYDLLVSLGSGGAYYGELEAASPFRYSKFLNSEEKKEINKTEFELYPILKQKNLNQLNKIVDFIERFPL